MELALNPNSIADYYRFLEVKRLPTYSVRGRSVFFPDEYAERVKGVVGQSQADVTYEPHADLFDYQRDITRMALNKRKFCIFADCGLGKTLMFLEYARTVLDNLPPDRTVLIISPLMVIPQTIREADTFHELAPKQIHAKGLQSWLDNPGDVRFAITNYDALADDTSRGKLGCLILDESSMLKSHYGKWGTKCLELGEGLEWKLACTGTPAPNDRIEFANHAVFMDAYPTVNSFLARFFVNRGQTSERWALKGHALGPFYRALSHWSIFLVNPGTYGWKDNADPLPPIHIHKHHVELTEQQADIGYEQTGTLFADQIGGITSRSVLSQVAKGNHQGKRIKTNKTAMIRRLLYDWPDESTIIWCLYNAEQKILEEAIPEAASIKGSTPHEERQRVVALFQSGEIKTLISKPKILGFGLNLQICTRQIFSGLQDSYESFYQAVKRSNRYGSTKPLNVHIPYTDIEWPMIQTVLTKADRVQRDTEEQERIFKNATT